MRNAVNPIVLSFGEEFFSRIKEAGVPEAEATAPLEAIKNQEDGKERLDGAVVTTDAPKPERDEASPEE